jgi:hypothetical protein
VKMKNYYFVADGKRIKLTAAEEKAALAQYGKLPAPAHYRDWAPSKDQLHDPMYAGSLTDAERALAKMTKPTLPANADNGLTDEENDFIERVPVRKLAGKTSGPAYAGRLKAAQDSGQLRFETAHRLRQFEREDYLNRKLDRQDAQDAWNRLVALNRERADWLLVRSGGHNLLHRLRATINAGPTGNTGEDMRALERDIKTFLDARVR